MISLFEGLPGSGKSYDATRKLLSNLVLGRRILTNIDGLELDHQRTVIKHYLDMTDLEIDEKLICLTEEQTSNFWNYSVKGDLIVIDEAQNYFNSRDWKDKGNREFGKWASEHRKRGVDLILITQNMARVESSVRSLVEWVYRYKKLNMFGGAIQKKYIRFAYYGESLEPLQKKVCTYDQKVFACYSSYFADGTTEIGIEKPVNVLKHPIFFLIPVVLFVFFYFLSQSSFITGDLFGASAIAHNEIIDSVSVLKNIDDKKEDNHDIFLGIVNGFRLMQSSDGGTFLH